MLIFSYLEVVIDSKEGEELVNEEEKFILKDLN